MDTRHYERSVPTVLADLLGHLTTLFRKESQLARAELSENMSKMGTGLALVVCGAVLLIPAIVVLLLAAVAAIEEAGLASPWASLIVGGAAFLIGIILAMVGVSFFKAENLVPNRTIHQLQEDASVAKRQVRQDDDYQRAA